MIELPEPFREAEPFFGGRMLKPRVGNFSTLALFLLILQLDELGFAYLHLFALYRKVHKEKQHLLVHNHGENQQWSNNG